MTEKFLTVKSNVWLADGTLEMVLSGDSINMKAGQFVELSIEGLYLRRPISVAKCENNELTLLYKVVGQGTKIMSNIKVGDKVGLLCDLGNGFDLSKSKKPLLIGGGIGVAPLYQVALEFHKRKIKPTIILGFKNKMEMFYLNEFSALGKVIIATDDGSYGEKGNVIDILKTKNIKFDEYFACGPMVMLNALANQSKQGQVSLEARMGCGFGACMGCSIETKNGPKRVCKEGPVFMAEEVFFKGGQQ